MRWLALLLFAGCAAAPPPPPPCRPGVALLNATLWTQTAAEYRASALQTYAAARAALDSALASPSTTLPPAIILDLDETAFDNTRYAANAIRRDTTFKFDEHWSAYVESTPMRTIPGAREFLEYAASRGVTIVYITNRTANMEAATRRNLTALGYPIASSEDTLLTRGERPEWNSTNKTARREHVASRYAVLVLLGDDPSDFTDTSAARSTEARNALIAANESAFGTRWFVVANPMYGGWESAIAGSDGTACEQLRRKIEALRD